MRILLIFLKYVFVRHNYMVEIYIILLLHRQQLHVSALDNGHLHVVHESLISSYTNIYGEGVSGLKWARDLVSVRTVGMCEMHGGLMLLSV